MTSNTRQSQILETFTLIWLDSLVNDSIENIETQQRLRKIVKNLKTFQNSDQCMKHIELSLKDRIVLIVSGRLGQEIVPHIHQYGNVYSIYIYCMDKERNERWAKNYTKVKGVITKLDELVTQIRINHGKSYPIKLDQQLSIKYLLTNDQLNEFNDCFINSQLIIHYLLNMTLISVNKQEFLTLWNDELKGNNNELSILREFQKDYTPDKALWWFTRDTYVSRLLNKAFRTENIDLLLIFRFLIRDIQQLIALNKYQNPIHVYKCCVMSNEEILLMKNAIGEFISINTFFLAYLDRKQTLSFLNNSDLINDHENILFEIYAEPIIVSNKSFSNITSLSYYSGEEQILFTIGSIFRLISMHKDNDDIWIIRMKLSNEKYKEIESLFEHILNPNSSQSINVVELGRILRKMNRYDDAEKFYRRLLKELPSNHPSIADCHYGLGLVLDEKGDYESSIEWHQKSIEIKTQTLKPIDASLGHSYNSIGNVYQKNGNCKKALEYYNKTLYIWKKLFGENDLDVAMCLNNIGCIYEKQRKYSEALEYHQKSLAIKKYHLSSEHLNLSVTYNNLASIYCSIGQLDSALENLIISLNIKSKNLPKNNPEFAITFKNIGLIYEMKQDFNEAKIFYEKSAIIRRQTFPSTHPDVIRVEQDIRRILLKVT